MELKQYWNVIWKRRWLVLAIVGLTAILSAFMFLTTKPNYETQVRFITRQQPSPDNPTTSGVAGTSGNPDTPGEMVFTFDRYYNWFGSEFLVDDYTQIVESDAFARSMREIITADPSVQSDLKAYRTKNNNTELDTDKLDTAIKEGLTSDRRHRELRITIVAPSKPMAKALTNAAASILTDARFKPIKGTMVNDKAVFSQIDTVTDEQIKSSRSKELINAIIRVIVGLVAALAIAFLLEYLDGSVRDERDAARVLDLPVLGAIPRI